MRHNPGYGIMAALMSKGAREMVLRFECTQSRHLDEIVRGAEEGLVAAVADVGRYCGEEGINRRLADRRLNDGGIDVGMEVGRQASDLPGVEHDVMPHEADQPRALLAGA